MTWIEFGCVRLRWPISEAAATASRRTAVPPSRPATQASESASRLSSCSRATLTCSIRLPVGDELVERRRVGGGAHGVAQRAIAEHLRELGKDLQVLLGRLFGHEEHEDEGDRRAVGRVERNRLCQTDEGAERLLQPLDAAVRDGDALAEAGRAEPLAGEQTVEYQAARDAIVILEQQAGLLEQPLLARRRQVDEHMGRVQQLAGEAHARRAFSPRSACPCSVALGGRACPRGGRWPRKDRLPRFRNTGPCRARAGCIRPSGGSCPPSG